ncbi:alpha/beta hydrolase [Geomicrobium sp. JSM 1781026]|uniref:alpha/beta hydrolase n=1 Tax=Geomicrobium sp. JSM 1781026 TaxID=3344580 RepID=UPI0035C078C5
MRFAKILTMIGSVFLAIVGLIYFFQEQIIFHPTAVDEAQTARLEAADGVEEMIVQTPDGTLLHGWFVGDSKQDMILYYGGNAENVSNKAAEVNERWPERNVVLMNYRGYGASEGTPGEEELFSDALYVYDEVAENAEQITVMGRSLGTAVAAYVADNRDVDRAIFVTPFDRLASVGAAQFPFLPVDLLLRHPFDTKEHLQDVSAPMLMIVAGDDEVVPFERSRALYESQDTAEWIVIGEHGHNTIHTDPTYWDRIERFLETK